MKRLILALVILTMILCVGCGKAAEPAETETAPETVEIAPVETATPSPEPTPEPTPSPTPEPPSEPGTVLINGTGVLLTTLDRGTTVSVINEFGDYYVIELDGVKGYIEKWLVRMGVTEELGNKGYARSKAKVFETAYC